MIWSKPDKEKERYYLLPGQGGPAARRKRNYFLAWSIVVGVIVSLAFALGMLYANRGFVK
jgi:hypothetical protein